jgi:hypothetical protein
MRQWNCFNRNTKDYKWLLLTIICQQTGKLDKQVDQTIIRKRFKSVTKNFPTEKKPRTIQLCGWVLSNT